MILILFGFLLTISIGIESYQQEDRFAHFKYEINHASASLNIGNRVSGGIQIEHSDFYKFNYQIGMFIRKQDGTLSICGGAIVHPQVILTAAHCVYKAVKATIFKGTHRKPYSEEFPGKIDVYPENITIHEDYDDYTLSDDIASIYLNYGIGLSENVGIIPLASYDFMTCEDGIAWVSGWGKTENSDYSIPDVMNYLQVDPISYSKCYSYYDFLEDKKQLCSSGDLYKGICPGDSGGPYAFENEYKQRFLCGINSFVSITGCINNLPKGYTSVAYYNDNGWLCYNSKGAVGCSKFDYADLVENHV